MILHCCVALIGTQLLLLFPRLMALTLSIDCYAGTVRPGSGTIRPHVDARRKVPSRTATTEAPPETTWNLGTRLANLLNRAV
mmetsp:Transcript_46656/g.92843  ORF Transcript_46656/g.92843 Transcript_46656/m.92843 type:complete len:82 (-) Transcript_46656:625-870(-)